jgi:hypothetical protein
MLYISPQIMICKDQPISNGLAYANLFGMGQNTLKRAKKGIGCQINLNIYVKMSMFGNWKVIVIVKNCAEILIWMLRNSNW